MLLLLPLIFFAEYLYNGRYTGGAKPRTPEILLTFVDDALGTVSDGIEDRRIYIELLGIR
jgi:hypothetical protein